MAFNVLPSCSTSPGSSTKVDELVRQSPEIQNGYANQNCSLRCPKKQGSVALTLLGAVSAHVVQSSSDREDVEQLVDETHFVLHVRLTGEAMAPANHARHFEALDGSGRRLHSLKAPCRANDALESTLIRFNDVV